jgi:hypothetical protein
MSPGVSARMPARLASLFLLFLSATALRASDLQTATETVARIRGAAFRRPVVVKTIRRADLEPYFRAQVARSTQGTVDDYVTSLEVLQLIEPGGDPLGELLSLYQAQVLAFYSPTEHVYYQIEGAPPGMPANPLMDDTIELHELMHALQDQTFGAGKRLETIETDWDAQLAYQSLLEGEATLVMIASLVESAGSSLDEVVKSDMLVKTLGNAALMDQAMPKGTPRYYAESLAFPYAVGFRFVLEAYRRGGWKALDAVHRRPPTSSAELLHPELYFDETFHAVKILKTRMRAPYEILDSTLGEFHWRFLLRDAALAATWRADRVQIVENAACEPTVLIDSRWATAADAVRFRDAYTEKLAERGIGALTTVDGTAVRVAYGADVPLTRSFVAGARPAEAVVR